MQFEREPGRIFASDLNGRCLAEVTFACAQGVCTIDHTFVDPLLRGRGVAQKLLLQAAEQIRACGFKARPVCPYAIKWFAEHPEQADLL